MSEKILNFNIGVLGHVDSGKTSLVKTLSSVASTAAFDKNPQSQERGITIDLGFSSFYIDYPECLKSAKNTYETLQYTLVDCPGHASLIRTIIGGAQIIDMMLLVIDVTKGIQTQTAECLVIGEITCDHLLIVINKVDLLPVENRTTLVNKMMKKIAKTLEKTKFSGCPMVPVAANPSGSSEGTQQKAIGIDTLIDTITQLSYVPHRSVQGPFTFVVDHCFAIKGQGTVMTGTVVQGCVSINDQVEVPCAKITRKVKSIQMFKKPIEKAMQGDRVGICVTQFDPKLLERGSVCTPGHMTFVDAVIASVQKISYFKGSCGSDSKFHITIMHDTVLAKCTFFRLTKTNLNKGSPVDGHKIENFSYENEYIYLDELGSVQDKNKSSEQHDSNHAITQYALLQFDKPVVMSEGSLLIGSKLDMDIHSNVCRLAFHGKAVALFTGKQQLEMTLPNLKVFKYKNKEGIVDRITNEHEVIGRNLFKKETNIQLFVNLKVTLSTGEEGIIEGGFGQSGKIKIRIPNGLLPETMKRLPKQKGKKGEDSQQERAEPINIQLSFKRYIYDPKKKIIQS